MGLCVIKFVGWILDLRLLALRSILHGGWGWAQTNMLRRSIRASNNYIGTNFEEHWAQGDMWHTTRGGAPCTMRLGE